MLIEGRPTGAYFWSRRSTSATCATSNSACSVGEGGQRGIAGGVIGEAGTQRIHAGQGQFGHVGLVAAGKERDCRIAGRLVRTNAPHPPKAEPPSMGSALQWWAVSPTEGRPMQDAQYWLNEFWTGLSVLDLLGGSVLGTLLGLALGILGWRWLHRRGWLQRRTRWHHWLLASYVVLLPLATAFFGLQLGFTAGAHRALFKQLDHFQPHLQTLVEGWSEGFTDSLDDPRMREALRSQGTVGDVADTIASAYLSEHPLPGLDRLGNGPLARGTGWVIGKVREGLLRGMVEDTLVDKAGTLGLEPKVVREALTMHVDELLHTRGVLRLVKAQINGMMPGVYFGLLLPLLVIALLIALEIWAARRFGWTRQVPSSAVVPAAGRQLQVPAEG
ncbi:hypothetical protein G6F65_013372 [Rhizopus arrhizus]|nr:hypothetical protein G6F65_013372 [Rhizopus arrhizus]